MAKKPPPPKITVLPYMGKPAPSAAELARKNWKPLTVATDGTVRKLPMIRERDE